MVLLRIGARPTSKEVGHCGYSRLEIVLDRPKRKIAADIRIDGCKHRGPLAAVLKKRQSLLLRRSFQRLPVRVDSPFPPRTLDRSDPLLGQSLIAGTSQLPGVTLHARLARIFGFDVEPEVVDRDVVAVNGGEKFADLG